MVPLLSVYLARQRIAMVRPYLRGDVLDLGCGYAHLVSSLQPGQVYVGIDRNAALLDKVRTRYPQHTFCQSEFDTERLPLRQRFHTVVMLAVIEHLRQPDHLFSQLRDCLQPQGQVLMTSPSAWGNRIHSLGARIGLFSLEAARDHSEIFSKASLAARVRPHGLALVRYRRFEGGGNQLFVCRALSPLEAGV